nr:diaminopimelate epimerase [Betaproteobacteria bacterium]
GIITPKLENSSEVTVNMGKPEFEPGEIPFLAANKCPTYHLELPNKKVKISVLSMGNPHAVRIIDDIEQAPVNSEGALIAAHATFPNQVNVGYMQIIHRNHIKLRVYERGAGETLACGTGACAAVVTGVNLGLLDSKVTVSTRGGDLTISWAKENAPVFMTGPAVTVFEGEINL